MLNRGHSLQKVYIYTQVLTQNGVRKYKKVHMEFVKHVCRKYEETKMNIIKFSELSIL